MYSETRNLRLHFLMASQRLVDLNTKIRGRTKLMIGKVNIDDFDLKVRRILRYSKHRKEILNLPKGSFLYPEKDVIVHFPLFKQEGKPYLFKPKQQEKPKRKTAWQRLDYFHSKPRQTKPFKINNETYEQQQDRYNKEDEEEDSEEEGSYPVFDEDFV